MNDFLARLSEYKDSQDECCTCGKPVLKGRKYCSYKCRLENTDRYRCVACNRRVERYYTYCSKCRAKKGKNINEN